MSSVNVLDLFKLTDKVALVTGGAKGLGTMLNEGLLEAGVSTLIICGRGRHGTLNIEEKRLSRLSDSEIIGIQCDVSDESQVLEMVTSMKDNVGRIDILVNNAGVTWNAPTSEQTLATWHRVIDTNLTGLFLVTREIAKNFMIPQESGGSIINISSTLAFQGIEVGSQIGYTASKAGVLGLTRQLAIEWSKWSIRVNAITPSFIEGDTMAKLFTDENSPMRETLLEMIPTGRFNNANDLKATVCFLASKASSNITGQYIVIDGGLSIK